MSWYSALIGADRRRNRQVAEDNAPGGINDLRGQQDAAMGTARARGATAEDAYSQFATSYDPQEAVNTYAQGAYGGIERQLNKRLADLRGQAAGAGRLDTGFYDQDVGTIAQDASGQLAESLSRAALQASGQKIGIMENYGGYGERQTGVANDLLTARREELENARREADERKRRKRSGVAGIIGGTIGLIGSGGNPAGWEIGSQAGSSTFG